MINHALALLITTFTLFVVEATATPSETYTPPSTIEDAKSRLRLPAVMADPLLLARAQNDAAVLVVQQSVLEDKLAYQLLKDSLKTRISRLGNLSPCSVLSMNNLAAFELDAVRARVETLAIPAGATERYVKVALLRKQPQFKKLPKECGLFLSLYWVADVQDSADFEEFYETLRAALKKQDRNSVVHLFQYPMTVSISPRRDIVIKSPADFMSHYDTLLPRSAQKDILKTPISDIFWRDEGISTDLGMVWFRGRKILSVSKPLK